MKNGLIIIAAVMGLFTLSTGFSAEKHKSSKIKFISGTYDDAVKMAKEEGKPIFMDAYTDWCHWCKVLDKKTFSDEDVAEYLNENFINVRVDMESRIGRKLAKKYSVRGYPTLLFISGEESVLSRIDGYVKARPFIRYAKQAKKEHEKKAG